MSGLGAGGAMVLTIAWILYPSVVPNPVALIPLVIATIVVGGVALVL